MDRVQSSQIQFHEEVRALIEAIRERLPPRSRVTEEHDEMSDRNGFGRVDHPRISGFWTKGEDFVEAITLTGVAIVAKIGSTASLTCIGNQPEWVGS